MKYLRKSITAGLIVLASGAFALASAQTASAESVTVQASSVEFISAGNCSRDDNLGETAQSFISRCRKGSINREFPGQLLQTSLKDIKSGNSADYKKAWKLLNDNRFKK
ncbi:hypothetical protein [Nocardia aurea]|uniref:Uncharacterized protein n=1 Tax=Nocardia aurea TaxID=2144174 RepID=A0ABV3G1P4_9NOCA